MAPLFPPRPKGKPGRRPGEGGRPPGTKNKISADARKVFKDLLENMAPQAQEWLEHVAATDKARALEILLKVSERFIPKLQRHVVSTDAGEPVSITISGIIRDPTKEPPK